MSIRVGLRHMARALGPVAPPEARIEATIFSDYNLCSSIPFKKLTVSLTSIGTLSVTEIRLTASPSPTIGYLGSIPNPKLTPSPTSTYSLSTTPT